MAGKKEISQDELEALMYAGATPYEDEEDESESANRGDDFVPTGDDESEQETDAGVEDPAPEAPAEAAEESAEAEGEEPAAEEPAVEEPEAEEPKAEEPKHDEARIPKKRFDEINERRKAAERRLAELEAERKASDPGQYVDFDFDAKEELYAQHVLDGDLAKAKEIRAEIRRAEQTAFEKMAENRAVKVGERQKLQSELDTTIVELNAAYPVYDPSSPSYDQDVVDETLELQRGFIDRGYTPAVALRRAAEYVAAVNGLKPEAEIQAAPKAAVVPLQKKPDIAKKIAAAEKQPPKQQGRNSASEALVDLDSISEEEFDALPESKLRALRGDLRM
jgi:hypothetical protein